MFKKSIKFKAYFYIFINSCLLIFIFFGCVNKLISGSDGKVFFFNELGIVQVRVQYIKYELVQILVQ